jgi:hypothetical protein
MFCGFDLDNYILQIGPRYMALRLVIVTSLANYHIITSKSPVTPHTATLLNHATNQYRATSCWQRQSLATSYLRRLHLEESAKEELWRYHSLARRQPLRQQPCSFNIFADYHDH